MLKLLEERLDTFDFKDAETGALPQRPSSPCVIVRFFHGRTLSCARLIGVGITLLVAEAWSKHSRRTVMPLLPSYVHNVIVESLFKPAELMEVHGQGMGSNMYSKSVYSLGGRSMNSSLRYHAPISRR